MDFIIISKSQEHAFFLVHHQHNNDTQYQCPTAVDQDISKLPCSSRYKQLMKLVAACIPKSKYKRTDVSPFPPYSGYPKMPSEMRCTAKYILSHAPLFSPQWKSRLPDLHPQISEISLTFPEPAKTDLQIYYSYWKIHLPAARKKEKNHDHDSKWE